MERIHRESGKADGARTAQRRQEGGEGSLADSIHNSPMMVAQRQRLDCLFGPAIQRVEDEEPLQGKFDTAQRAEDEEPLQGKSEAAPSIQRQDGVAKPNDTGLPDNLKSGIESLSGMSMDNVRVHYNSSQPAQLNAHAYAQGTDIHLAPGQEQHLPHEAWHVVQQAQGRVRPTMQMKQGVQVNDDKSLETEADVMGAEAASVGLVQEKSIEPAPIDTNTQNHIMKALAPKADPCVERATQRRIATRQLGQIKDGGNATDAVQRWVYKKSGAYYKNISIKMKDEFKVQFPNEILNKAKNSNEVHFTYYPDMYGVGRWKEGKPESLIKRDLMKLARKRKERAINERNNKKNDQFNSNRAKGKQKDSFVVDDSSHGDSSEEFEMNDGYDMPEGYHSAAYYLDNIGNNQERDPAYWNDKVAVLPINGKAPALWWYNVDTVEDFKMLGSREDDNRKLGKQSGRIWHHVYDYNSTARTCTMQSVPSGDHGAWGHTGGASQAGYKKS